jgi:hypothetical protein
MLPKSRVRFPTYGTHKHKHAQTNTHTDLIFLIESVRFLRDGLDIGRGTLRWT